MITLKRHPKEGRVLLNNNPCVVIAQVDPDPQVYYRVVITVNEDEQFEESWSKISDRLEIDLRHFYTNRFPAQSYDLSTSTITKVNEPLIQINLTINEYALADDSLISTQDVPQFFMLETFMPDVFDDSAKLKLLGSTIKDRWVHQFSVIRVMFYFNNSIASKIRYTLVNDQHENLIVKEINEISPGIYMLQLKLDIVNLTKVNYLQIGDETKNYEQIVLRLKDISYYSATPILYKNIHGAFVSADLFGETSIEYPHERESYQLNDDSYATYQVTTSTAIQINTGHLYQSQIQLLKNINESREVFLKLDNTYQKARIATRKSPGAVKNQFLYDGTIDFIIDPITGDNDSKFDVI
ncbi:hypothetical protein ACH3O9_11430 [Leeuwenhoekiella sp. A16]|uniref:hypothetical protein n=1 Tax=Leeuwenhoekiella sp. A16 TaxID=3141462 RepID=UPI003A7FAFF4